MREIKFRAWNQVSEKMLSWNEFLNTNMKNTFIAPESTGLVLMQFTGLYDKNGTEIYEGDIVKIDCPTMKIIGEVRYSEMSATFFIYDKVNDIEETLWYQKEEYEVIGNIYDNPELLEGE